MRVADVIHASCSKAELTRLCIRQRVVVSCTVLLLAMGVLLSAGPKLDAQAKRSASATHQSSRPLTKAGLEKALRLGGMKSDEMVTAIKRRGVDFELDHDTEMELRGAGADANIIEAVSQNFRGTPAGQSSVTKADAPTPAPAPPKPTSRDVTLPVGTLLSVQLTETLSSATATVGQQFHGTTTADVVMDGLTVMPRGTGVTGRVSAVKDATHFSGNSLLTIELATVDLPGQSSASTPIVTMAVTQQGAGRGKNTAIKTGVGAGAGAVLGGIFGGGKGAAIGAAAGGGAGAGTNAITKGQQVEFRSESTVQFTLSAPAIVKVSLLPSTTAPAERRPMN